MRYSELIAFEPIDSVKVLTEANDTSLARRDISSFVISPQMRRMFIEQLLPHLRLDASIDNKGVFVVANYGTGKTHLMAVVSAIAEHSDLASELRDEAVLEATGEMAGSFRVIRAEIGATKMGLRDIVCQELERGLREMGVDYAFPPLDEVSNTKDSLVDMMAAFERVEPERGLLFALDELLDYLRSRRDAELIVDLAFLREIGEICRSTRFRFVAGIQEALFDNPRFAHASDAIRRVRDRFEQVRISRDDVAYVVQERLLRKDAAQKQRIREHLQRFTSAFEGMAERLEDFVSLFPVHPSYLRTFEQVTLVEKRRVLTTLSHAMGTLLDHQVPAHEPGLICFDSYRAELDGDPSNRSIPDVAAVLDRAQVLRSKLETAMPPNEAAVAVRVVDALAVHRLTTEDIHAPIGMTVDELRDDLCLIPDGVPELEAGFIRTSLDLVVDEIVTTVSGQFLSRDMDNGQLYLDVRKDIDYDELINKRADSLDAERLDHAYFKALEQVLEQRDAPYVSGYRIWGYELPWATRGVTRLGYLFMGAPNERSTAQPPRDFYLYFIQPYDPPAFEDDQLSDEAFIRLESPAEEFTRALRRYAGASALAVESTEHHRIVYDDKAKQALQTMVVWLRQNMASTMTVTYRGNRKALGAWPHQLPGGSASVKAQIDAVAARALEPHFDLRYPGYPVFTVEITRESLDGAVQAAISQIASRRATALGTKVLRSLELVDHEGRMVTGGEFAAALEGVIEAAGGKAVNRGELLHERDRGVPTWGPWRLEPAWLVVVAAALCHAGRLELGYADGQIDALSLDRLTRMSREDLEQLTHLAPPKALPLVALRDVAELLDVPPGSVPDSGANDVLVRQVLDSAHVYLDRVVEAEQHVANGVLVWGAHVIDLQEERLQRLMALRRALEDVKGRDSIGKLNKLSLDAETLREARAGKRELLRTEAIARSRNHLATLAYVQEAQSAFGEGDPFPDEAAELRERVRDIFRAEEIDEHGIADARREAERLKTHYAEEAEHAHLRDRLDADGERHKAAILNGVVVRDLERLATIDLLPSPVLASLQQRLAAIGTCPEFRPGALASSVKCPLCGYVPRASGGPTAKAQVEEIDEELRRLLASWTETLQASVNAPEIAKGIPLVKAGREQLEAFRAGGELSSPVDEQLVAALEEVLRGFTIRNLSPGEVYDTLFVESRAISIATLQERFAALIERLCDGVDAGMVRVLPVDEEQP
jgi:hypothetical protein